MPEYDASGSWDGCICARWIGALRQPKFDCGYCEMLVFRACGTRHNFYGFSLYHNPDLDDRIHECLLTAMAAVLAEDLRASFLFVDDLTVNILFSNNASIKEPTGFFYRELLHLSLKKINQFF